jgi:hypothetical protein
MLDASLCWCSLFFGFFIDSRCFQIWDPLRHAHHGYLDRRPSAHQNVTSIKEHWMYCWKSYVRYVDLNLFICSSSCPRKQSLKSHYVLDGLFLVFTIQLSILKQQLLQSKRVVASYSMIKTLMICLSYIKADIGFINILYHGNNI